MRVGIMQPYFFPYIGYWQLINAVDKYVVYDDVAFIKGGWISRNNILLNGKAHLLTLPLHNVSSFRNICEIEVTHNVIARKKVIKTLASAYRKAAYFESIFPMIEKLILESKTISELNYNAIIEINKYIGIQTDIILSSEMDKDCELKGQAKVISISHILGADMYVNAFGGRNLYSEEDFRKEGLELRFLKMGDIRYKQYKDEFVPRLSIIDVLMFNEAAAVKEYLNRFTLGGGGKA